MKFKNFDIADVFGPATQVEKAIFNSSVKEVSTVVDNLELFY